MAMSENFAYVRLPYFSYQFLYKWGPWAVSFVGITCGMLSVQI